jgi:hypothetical protein
VNKEKHELKGRLLALAGKGVEAAAEVGWLGELHPKVQEMVQLGKSAEERHVSEGVSLLQREPRMGVVQPARMGTLEIEGAKKEE